MNHRSPFSRSGVRPLMHADAVLFFEGCDDPAIPRRTTALSGIVFSAANSIMFISSCLDVNVGRPCLSLPLQDGVE